MITDAILKLMEERRQEKSKVEEQIHVAKEQWLNERGKEVEHLQEEHKNRELHKISKNLHLCGNPGIRL